MSSTLPRSERDAAAIKLQFMGSRARARELRQSSSKLRPDEVREGAPRNGGVPWVAPLDAGQWR